MDIYGIYISPNKIYYLYRLDRNIDLFWKYYGWGDCWEDLPSLKDVNGLIYRLPDSFAELGTMLSDDNGMSLYPFRDEHLNNLYLFS